MTTLKTNFKDGPGFDLELFPDTGLPDKWVTLTAPRGGVYSIPREKFASAVRDLGFVVIDKADLPEVEPAPERGPRALRIDGDVVHVDTKGSTEVRHRQTMRNLAIDTYLEANPPLPPKVASLAAVLRDASERGDFEDHAAQLINSGRIDIKEAS